MITNFKVPFHKFLNKKIVKNKYIRRMLNNNIDVILFVKNIQYKSKVYIILLVYSRIYVLIVIIVIRLYIMD